MLRIARNYLPAQLLDFEIVERKGKGHPDTICDQVAEKLSIALSRYYYQNFGRILHFNLDKCMLIGGQARVGFGYGDVLEPMCFMVVGRAATNLGDKMIPVGRLVVEVTREWFGENFRYLDPDSDLIVDYRIKPGSESLTWVSEQQIPRSNDSSVGAAFGPLSDTEKIVYSVERMLNDPQTKGKYPGIGEDIKVLGIRSGDHIELIIACAIICSEVSTKEEYMELKHRIGDLALAEARKYTQGSLGVKVNLADNPSLERYYLTVTGTSAEHGDDGQVGRGNKLNGLITPCRHVSPEAIAGKNPVSHVGKIYNVACSQIVDLLIRSGVEHACCYMVSKIGSPIDEPQLVGINAHTQLEPSELKSICESVVDQVLDRIPDLWLQLMEKGIEF